MGEGGGKGEARRICRGVIRMSTEKKPLDPAPGGEGEKPSGESPPGRQREIKSKRRVASPRHLIRGGWPPSRRKETGTAILREKKDSVLRRMKLGHCSSGKNE